MILSGNSIMAFLGQTAGSTANPRSIGFATNHQLSINQELKDIQHKDAGGGRYSVASYGSISWSITSSNFIGNTVSAGDSGSKSEQKREGHSYISLYKLMMDRKPVYLVFGLEGDDNENDFNNTLLNAPEGGWSPDETGKRYLSGWAYISSLTASAPVNDYATFDVEFTGTGELTLANSTEAGEFMSLNEPVPVAPVTTTATKAEKATATKA